MSDLRRFLRDGVSMRALKKNLRRMRREKKKTALIVIGVILAAALIAIAVLLAVKCCRKNRCFKDECDCYDELGVDDCPTAEAECEECCCDAAQA